MPIEAKKATLVLVLLAGALALLAGPAASALGSTGGAGAPGVTSPATPAKPIRPSGIATWFGPGFYGKKTACGQTLTREVIGVANRTLPCGTLVKVSYKGHTLTIPVLDRGPYSHIASWDLTSGAAEALGITETVRIQTRVIGTTANVPTLGLPEQTPAAKPSPSAIAAGGASAAG